MTVLSGHSSDVVTLCKILEGRLRFPGVLKAVHPASTTSWNEKHEVRVHYSLLHYDSQHRKQSVLQAHM